MRGRELVRGLVFRPVLAACLLDERGGAGQVVLGQRVRLAQQRGQLPDAAVPAVRAATTGSDFFRARRSERTGLPVTAGLPQMPSRSSVSWKA